MRPFASVIMPVFNAEKYLRESIESILYQTHKDFEFLIFDDGSTDQSLKIINSYSDPRIKIFHFPQNTGYVKHLNKGIEMAKGKYLIRMDADDISLPSRFEEQIKFMEENSELGASGTWIEEFGTSPRLIRSLPIEHDQMVIQQLYFTPIVHPASIIRKEVLMRYNIRYKEEFLFAEDTELWIQIAKVAKLGNLPRILLKYRVHEKSVSSTKWHSHQFPLLKKIRLEQYENLIGRELKPIEKQFIFEELNPGIFNLLTLSRFFKELKKKNEVNKRYNTRYFSSFINKRILGIVSGKRSAQPEYLMGIILLPIMFPSIFFEARIYVRLFQKMIGFFQRKSAPSR